MYHLYDLKTYELSNFMCVSFQKSYCRYDMADASDLTNGTTIVECHTGENNRKVIARE